MTSIRRIEANRRNAISSTGPRTDDGKDRSRRNAIRHGLSAETVIEIVEDLDDYRAFEAAVIADYDPLTAVERELVLRLASLLWRLRRASAIETDLFRIQAEILWDRRATYGQECQTVRISARNAGLTKLPIFKPTGLANLSCRTNPSLTGDPPSLAQSAISPIPFSGKTILIMGCSRGWDGTRRHYGVR
jgi:hypothetical protein